jgi:hypothetical protein
MWCQIDEHFTVLCTFLTIKYSVLGRPLGYILICTVDNKYKKQKKTCNICINRDRIFESRAAQILK